MSNVGLLAPPVVPGFEYAVRIEVSGGEAVFPQGVQLRAQVRRFAASGELIAELTTENGGLSRVDDRTVEVRISRDATAELAGKQSIIFDLVRTDVEPENYLYLQMQIYTITPVTRGAA